MNKMSKLVAVLLVFVFAISFSTQIMAATSASFESNDYCTVKISQSLMNSKKYKTATVKITTYDQIGWKSNGKINVKLTDGNGNYIGTYQKKSGDTIKLGNDHSSYRIYISKYEEPVNGFWAFIKSGNNFTNSGKCVSWKVSNNKNCTIK